MIYAYNPQHLLNILVGILPAASPQLSAPTDGVAALVHAIQTSLGFQVVSPLSDPPKVNPEATPSGSGDEPPRVGRPQQVVNGPLKEGWNAKGEDVYAFEYVDGQDVYRIRVGRLGGRVQVSAHVRDGEPYSFSVLLSDIIDPSAFPVTVSAEPAAKQLGFVSDKSVEIFAERYKNEISIPLHDLTKQSSGSDPKNPPPPAEATEPSTRHSVEPPNVLGTSQSGHPAASIGHRDLDPVGLGQRPGAYNPHDGGGMLMDFNHPLFDSRRRGDPDFSGPGGTIQPPGARWDPVGPGFEGAYPSAGNNPLSGGVGPNRRNFGDDLAPPGQFGPDLGAGFGGNGSFGARGSRGGGGGGGAGGGFGGSFGGGMFM